MKLDCNFAYVKLIINYFITKLAYHTIILKAQIIFEKMGIE